MEFIEIIQPVMVAFQQESDEDPLQGDDKAWISSPEVVSQLGHTHLMNLTCRVDEPIFKLLNWHFTPATGSLLIRFLFGLRCMLEDDDRVVDELGELYQDVLRKQEEKLNKGLYRSVSSLRSKAHHYSVAYMALAIVSVLAALPIVRSALEENEGWRLPIILEQILPSLTSMSCAKLRWPTGWAEMECYEVDQHKGGIAPNTATERKHYLTDDLPEYHLWYVGTRQSNHNYDSILKRRVRNVGRTLLRLVLGSHGGRSRGSRTGRQSHSRPVIFRLP